MGVSDAIGPHRMSLWSGLVVSARVLRQVPSPMRMAAGLSWLIADT